MKILVAIEDRQIGRQTIPLIKSSGAPDRAEIKIVTVIPSIMAYASLANIPDLMQEVRNDARVEASALVHEVALAFQAAFPSAAVQEQVAEGTAAHEILTLAGDWPADLIVVGSHGYRGMRRLVLGSVSQAIVSQAPCSVLIYSARADKELPENTCPDLVPAQAGQRL